MFASDYRSTARSSLRGKWGISLLVTLVATLLGANAGGGIGNSFTSSSMSSAGGNASSYMPYGGISPYFMGLFFAFIATIAVFIFIYAVVAFVIGGAMDLGLKQYNMRLIMGQPQQPFTTLFERFQIFGKALLLQLAMSLFIFLWALLFFIPGIIAAYRYAMAPYLMAADPSLGVMQAIDMSKQMMKGNKWRLFCLHFSFIGWIFLATLSFGIGFLWLNPYMGAAEAAFYLDLTGHLQNRPQEAPQGAPQQAPYTQPPVM